MYSQYDHTSEDQVECDGPLQNKISVGTEISLI